MSEELWQSLECHDESGALTHKRATKGPQLLDPFPCPSVLSKAELRSKQYKETGDDPSLRKHKGSQSFLIHTGCNNPLWVLPFKPLSPQSNTTLLLIPQNNTHHPSNCREGNDFYLKHYSHPMRSLMPLYWKMRALNVWYYRSNKYAKYTSYVVLTYSNVFLIKLINKPLNFDIFQCISDRTDK